MRINKVLSAGLAVLCGISIFSCVGYANNDPDPSNDLWEEITEIEAPEYMEVSSGSFTTTAECDVVLPNIKVTVPGYVEIVNNPYELPYNIGAVQTSTAIVCPDILIKNYGTSKIAVYVKGVGSCENSEVVLTSTGTVNKNSVEKQIALFVEGGKPVKNKAGVVTGYSYANKYNANTMALIKTDASAAEYKQLTTVNAAGTDTNGDVIPSVGSVKISGAVNTNKNITWYVEDLFDVTLTFKFKCLPN